MSYNMQPPPAPPLPQQPMAQQPMVQQPMVQQPMAQQPMAQQPMVQQPMVQPVIQQPMQMMSNTTVVVNGNSGGGSSNSMRAWSTGLCGCFEDIGVCLMVMICPMCYGMHLSSKAQESCLIPIIVPAWLIALRSYTRGRHDIQGTVCDDCVKVSCCFQLTMCQLSRELDNIRNGKTPL